VIVSALEVSTDTVIAVLVTAVVCGIVPTILLLVKIANDRAARIRERMDKLAEQASETNLRSKTNRGNVEELWQERDDLRKAINGLSRSLQNHSQLLKAAKSADSS
jgi:uncharacterized membrane protein (DUF106 family)